MGSHGASGGGAIQCWSKVLRARSEARCLAGLARHQRNIERVLAFFTDWERLELRDVRSWSDFRALSNRPVRAELRSTAKYAFRGSDRLHEDRTRPFAPATTPFCPDLAQRPPAQKLLHKFPLHRWHPQ